MNKVKKYILPFTIVLFLTVVGTAYAGLKEKSSAAKYVSVQKQDMQKGLLLEGKLQAKDGFDLGFERSGKVAKIYVKAGDVVKKGQLLAELSVTEVSTAYAQALEDKTVAQAQLQQAKDDKDAQSAKFKNVQNSSTATKYDEKYQKEVLNQSKSNIEAKEALVQKNIQAVNNAKLQIGKTKIYAPSDGVLTKQILSEGEVVTAYTPVISLINGNDLEIKAVVSEMEVAQIAVGDKAEVKIKNGQTKKYEAVVATINPKEINAEGIAAAYEIKFTLASQDEQLKSGMTADVFLLQGEQKNVLSVPVNSIFKEQEKSYVLLKKGTSSEKQEVELGLEDQFGKVEVLKGLEEGDQIVQFN